MLSRLLKNRKLVAGILAVVLLVAVSWMATSGKGETKVDVIVSPKRGAFTVVVTTTGELQAKSSISIMGPENARAANIWQMKLNSLVPEGTVVKKGDFVADLDRSEITNRFKESQLNVQKLEAQYTQAKLDSQLTLSVARDELVNLYFGMEEKRIALEQSAYEAPAIRRQAQIDLERAQRTYAQAQKNYVTKTQQAIAKIQAVEADLMKEQQRLGIYMKTADDFTIKAPADGMVIYAREWNGKKKVVGSTINAWEPTVATLPDLRVMESITYVNEIDIQKIAVGQTVKVKLDADPKKQLTGVVTQVANIGEQRPNSDSKVFEVRIGINESDTTLRPSMTTGNEILVSRTENALYIPLECVHTEGNTTYVIKKRGGGAEKQEVRLGKMNENEVVVLAGVQDNEQLYLSTPGEAEKLTLNILPPAGK